MAAPEAVEDVEIDLSEGSAPAFAPHSIALAICPTTRSKATDLVDVLLERRSFQGEGALGWVMPPERGWDIDTAFDFLVCEAVWPHVRGEGATPLDSVRR